MTIEVKCSVAQETFGPTWHEMLCSIFSGFEAWKFDRRSMQNIVRSPANSPKKVQLCSKIFAPIWYEMFCAIFSGFEAWKFDNHSMQNSGYVGIVVGVVFSFCVFCFILIALLRNPIKTLRSATPFYTTSSFGEHRAACITKGR